MFFIKFEMIKLVWLDLFEMHFDLDSPELFFFNFSLCDLEKNNAQ